MIYCVIVICYYIIILMSNYRGKVDKITKILVLYNRLIKGVSINKTSFAIENSINKRSVGRGIEDIIMFLSEIYLTHELLFSRVSGEYCMTGCSNAEVTGVERMGLKYIDYSKLYELINIYEMA